MATDFDPAEFWHRWCTTPDPDRYTFRDEPATAHDGYERLAAFLNDRWPALPAGAIAARTHPGCGARGMSEFDLGHLLFSPVVVGLDPARRERVAHALLGMRGTFRAMGATGAFYGLLDELGHRALAETCLADEPDWTVHEALAGWAARPGPTHDRMVALTDGTASLPPDAPASLLAAYREVRRLLDGATAACRRCGTVQAERTMERGLCDACYATEWDAGFSSHVGRSDAASDPADPADSP